MSDHILGECWIMLDSSVQIAASPAVLGGLGMPPEPRAPESSSLGTRRAASLRCRLQFPSSSADRAAPAQLSRHVCSTGERE